MLGLSCDVLHFALPLCQEGIGEGLSALMHSEAPKLASLISAELSEGNVSCPLQSMASPAAEGA